MKKFISNVTHGRDLDGLASQSVLLRWSNKNKFKLIRYKVNYATYRHTLKKALEDNKKYKATLFTITDVGLDVKSGRFVVDTLKKIGEVSKVVYMDHHNLAGYDEELESLCELIHDKTGTKCATQLVQERFMPNDKISIKLAELAYLADFERPDPLVEKLGKVIAVTESNKGLNELVDKLSKGIFEDKKINKIYKKRKKAEEKEFPKIINRLQKYKIGEYIIGFSYSKIFSGSEITRRLEKIVDADLIVGVPAKKPSIILRRKNPKINAFKIASFLVGGGHKDRAGFVYNKPRVIKNKISPELISLIIRAVEETQNF